jgi:hypothetical protein
VTNPWKDLVRGPVGILFQVTYMILTVATCALAVYKLRRFASHSKPSNYVPIICLFLLTLATLGTLRSSCLPLLTPLCTDHPFPQSAWHSWWIPSDFGESTTSN